MNLRRSTAADMSDVDLAVKHRHVDIDGCDIFYRDAGSEDSPAVLLPHGYPSSSFQFRRFMPALADHWRLIAPNFPGFGYSGTPDPDRFDYTFGGYADFLERFTATMNLTRYALYLHDYGSQIGMQQPRRREIMIGLMEGLRANLDWFPKYQAYLREHQPPTLIVWGPLDGYMPEGAARAYLRDLPDAELHLLDGGHWALETNLDEIVSLARDFLGRVHALS